ncbi:MAG: adenylate cyclase [Rhodothermales bacterium]
MSFFEELKRRNVFRVGIAYVVTSWLLLQLSDVLAPLLNLPVLAQRFALFALVIGFVPALIFAWAFEMTPEGLKREKDVDRSQSIAPKTTQKLDRSIIVILALAVAFLLYKQMSQQPNETRQVAPESVVESFSPVDTKKSIAVLPFVNMSSDPEQEYFSDGLSEELLNRLAKNDLLHVAARTSAFQFKGQNLDIGDIGRQLNVAHVLEGSVRKSGNRLRITAQLIQVDNGFHLWSETYEREMDDIFAIQDEIAVAISEAMELELGASSQSSVQGQPTTSLEAYSLYLQARYLLAQRGEENMRQANELFARAVELDPEFSSAWSGMAFNSALLTVYSFRMSIEETFDITMNAARRAIELDPQNTEAYSAIGRALSDSLDWKGAQESFERAYELGPNDVSVLNLYGDFLGGVGGFDQAISLKRQAIELDPLAAVHAIDLAHQLLLIRRNEESVLSARRGVRLAPDLSYSITNLVQALVLSNAFDEAASLIEQTTRSWKADKGYEGTFSQLWAMLYYRTNDTDRLRQLVTESIRVLQTNEEDYESLEPAEIAFYLLSLDGVAAALPWLEQAFTEKGNNLSSPFFFYLPERMSDDPAWLEFWGQPRLKELLDMRRANPYPTNGLWKPQSELNGMTE